MITNIKFLKRYCKNYTKIENYAEAVKSHLKYDLHHRREISESKSASDLIAENLYYDRPPEELVFLEHREHIRLHKKGNQCALGHHCSEETKQKLSDAGKGHKGYWSGKIGPNKGHKGYWSGKPGTCLGKHWHLENGRRIYTD